LLALAKDLIKGDAAVWLCQEVPMGGVIAFPRLFVDKRGFRNGWTSGMMRRRRPSQVPDAFPLKKSQKRLDGRGLEPKIIRLIAEPCDATSVWIGSNTGSTGRGSVTAVTLARGCPVVSE
jgi:hypothetical protein